MEQITIYKTATLFVEVKTVHWNFIHPYFLPLFNFSLKRKEKKGKWNISRSGALLCFETLQWQWSDPNLLVIACILGTDRSSFNILYLVFKEVKEEVKVKVKEVKEVVHQLINDVVLFRLGFSLVCLLFQILSSSLLLSFLVPSAVSFLCNCEALGYLFTGTGLVTTVLEKTIRWMSNKSLVFSLTFLKS